MENLQKPPLKLLEIWAIRERLQLSSIVPKFALFDLAIDSKLRACDLTRLEVQDICIAGHVVARATFIQQETGRPVQVEMTAQARQRFQPGFRPEVKASRLPVPKSAARFSSCVDAAVCAHRSSLCRVRPPRRQRVRHVHNATNESLLYLSSHQEPAGGSAAVIHTTIQSKVRCLGIEVDDALEMAVQTEV